MPNFNYKGRSSGGGLVSGTIEAISMDAVASQLMSTGVTPIDIAQSKSSAKKSASILGSLRSKPPALQDLLLFSKQMYTLMKAGVPMAKAMQGLIQTTRNTQMVEAEKDILTNLESGRDLSSSMARHPNIFSTLFISMVRVGEESGRLDESFLQVSGYLEREKETRERIKAALRYPTFVIVAIAIAIGIINVVVIPVFARIFENANVQLPWQTRFLIATSDFFVQWWVLIIALIIGAIVGFRYYVKSELGRYTWDRYKLGIPLAGDIIYRAILSRFAQTFSMALRSGVPLIQAMAIVSRSVDNEYIGGNILSMRTGIERGESLTRTAGLSNMFTPLVLQMLAVGEETGQVDEMLTEVAEYYEREVDYDIKNLSSAIEPILIIAIGIMVLILALGVFLPMWGMSKAMGV